MCIHHCRGIRRAGSGGEDQRRRLEVILAGPRIEVPHESIREAATVRPKYVSRNIAPTGQKKILMFPSGIIRQEGRTCQCHACWYEWVPPDYKGPEEWTPQV